jgi:hypothetical protein
MDGQPNRQPDIESEKRGLSGQPSLQSHRALRVHGAIAMPEETHPTDIDRAFPPRVFDIVEAARVCHCHPNTIRNRLKTGKFPRPLPGGKYYWREEDIAAYLRGPRVVR